MASCPCLYLCSVSVIVVCVYVFANFIFSKNCVGKTCFRWSDGGGGKFRSHSQHVVCVSVCVLYSVSLPICVSICVWQYYRSLSLSTQLTFFCLVWVHSRDIGTCILEVLSRVLLWGKALSVYVLIEIVCQWVCYCPRVWGVIRQTWRTTAYTHFTTIEHINYTNIEKHNDNDVTPASYILIDSHGGVSKRSKCCSSRQKVCRDGCVWMCVFRNVLTSGFRNEDTSLSKRMRHTKLSDIVEIE